MPITLDWGNFEETFVVWKFELFWTWDELYASLTRLREMLPQQTATYHMIVDTRRCMMPSNSLLANVRTVPRYMPANLDKIVVITTHNLLPALTQNLHRMGVMIPGQIIFVETVDDAYHLVDDDEDV